MLPIKNLQLKKNTIFYTIIGFGLLLFSFLSLVLVKIYPSLLMISRSWLATAETLCSCSNYLSFDNQPIIFSLLIVSSVALILFFIFFAFSFLKINFLTRSFIYKILINKKKQLSGKLQNLSHELLLGNKVVEVEDEMFLAFCFGFWRPKICISSNLVKQLSDGELRAVLLHEKTHLQAYEPSKILLLKIIATVFFWLPFLKLLLNQYLTYAELEADQQATSGWRYKTDLAGALCKIIKNKEQRFSTHNLALSFFAVTDERINKLLDIEYLPQIKNWKSKILTSGLTVSLLLFFLGGLFFYDQPVVIYENNMKSCLLDNYSSCQSKNNMLNCADVDYFSGSRSCL